MAVARIIIEQVLRPSGWAVARMLSRLGERWGIEWLTYNPMVLYAYHLTARVNARGVVRTLERLFPETQRWVDIGAGSGAYAALAQRRGRAVQACEYNKLLRLVAKLQGVDSRRFDLTRDPPAELDGPFDLAYCLEVAEHLDPPLGDRLVQFMAAVAPTLVFTAAHPGQSGIGHVNERPASYWITRFELAGMTYRADLSSWAAESFDREGVSAPWLSENVMIFQHLTVST